jgi:hypothetical protein
MDRLLPKVSAVLFREGEWWVAQCLEYDIATQARRLEDLPQELHRLLTNQILASLEAGIEPFQGFSRAPRRFWEMYERAKSRVESVAHQEHGRVASPEVEARIAA